MKLNVIQYLIDAFDDLGWVSKQGVSDSETKQVGEYLLYHIDQT